MILPGLRLRPGSTAVNSPSIMATPAVGDVLRQPGGVLGADGVVVGQGAAVVDEALLDGRLHHVVLGQRVVVGEPEGEGEVQAGAGVVGVRQVAHDPAP